MNKYYKLTDQNMQTHNSFQWVLGEWVEAKPEDGNYDKPLCSDAWLHCYESPLLAVLHNPVHANIKNPRLFEVEVDGESKFNSQLKCGFRKMRLVKEIELPEMTTTQKTAYGILCAKEIYKGEQWNRWADNWLSGKDRNGDAAVAYAANANAAYAANANAAYAAGVAAAYAAGVAAAYAATYAANANAAANAANAATYAANAATYANAAANAADAAYVAANVGSLNLINMSENAMKY